MQRETISVLLYQERSEKSDGLEKLIPASVHKVSDVQALKEMLKENSFDLLVCVPDREQEELYTFLKDFRLNYPSIFFFLVTPQHGEWEEISCDFQMPADQLKETQFLRTILENMVRLAKIRKNNQNLSAMLLHDVRSPIQSLLGYLELLQAEVFGELNEGQQQLLSKAVALSDNLSDLVEELSLVYQFEKHRVDLLKTSIQPKKMIDQILRSMWILTDKKNIKLILQVSDPLPSLIADSLAVHRILSNLLLNAIKFTPMDGSIQVSVRHTHDALSKKMLEFRIVDSGPGIPEEKLGHIFNKYYRLEDIEQRQKGQGLGLYICRLLVEAHGGKIGAYNNREGGATFYFTLPLEEDK